MRAQATTLLAEGHAKEAGVVRIGLLGGFSVTVGERKVDEGAWRLRKAASLIKLLALASEHRLHRERAMDLLWPESAKKAASNNLRQTLHVARKTLHPDPEIASRLLSVSGEQLLVCPQGSLWVDVEAFEEAAETARRSKDPAAYRVAIELYSGELLPEDRYEEWAESRRQELRQRFLSLLVELAGLYEERGVEEDLAPAVQALRRVLGEEPTNEEAHVGLMRLYALSGRSEEALRQYGRLSEALSSGLGAEPSASARALREEIVAGRFRAGPTQPAGSPTKETPGGARAHNLPARRTSFVGREREMLEIKRTLAMTRLLTFTGTGGSGKTRLALEVARDLVEAYPDGVWLVELAGISEGELVPQAVANALGVQEQPGEPLTDTLLESLRNKSLLLMVDNCEHLIDAVARLADALLDGCPRLRVLATSREALGVAGETLWPVPTLSVPESQRMPTVAQLEGYEAVRLFVERASDRRPGFALAPANAAAVAEVCRRLEGVPLAIELAAARVSTISVEQIAERLENTLGLLTGGGRTAVARQRTLRGALDWSHELLPNEEQTLFGRLAVFAGGWTLEAAEAVGAGGGIGEGDVLELLSGLVDKSLVVAESTRDGGVRYRLLEPVRQYALEKLEHSGAAEAVRRRHTEYFLTLAEEAYPEPRGANQLQWLDRLEAEHDNLRAALSWTLGSGAPRLGLRLAATLFRFWDGRGYQSEGSAWLREALSKGSNATDSSARAMALVGLGIILVKQGNFEQAEACLNEALTLYEGLGDQGGAAKSLLELGWLEFERGATTRATALFEESLAVARDSGNRMIVPQILHGLANAVLSYGDHKRADRLFEEALASFRERGDAVEAARVLCTMGYAELALGDQVRATTLLEESLALAREFGDRHLTGGCLLSLGISAQRRGDPERAKTLLKESLVMGVEMGNKADIAENLEGLAEVAGALGEDVRAARIWGAAGGLREAIGRPWWSAERLLHKPQLSAARVRLDQAAWEAAFEEGQVMSLQEAVEYALSEQMYVTSEAPAPDQPSAVEQSPALTAREREVAAMVAQGLSNRQIAQGLFLSERTIEKHVSKILRKLGLASRAEIAAWATQQRLIAPEPA